MLEMLCKGWSSLQQAVACGRAEEAAQILRAAPKDAATWDSSKPYNASLLHLAIFSGDIPTLRLLVSGMWFEPLRQ